MSQFIKDNNNDLNKTIFRDLQQHHQIITISSKRDLDQTPMTAMRAMRAMTAMRIQEKAEVVELELEDLELFRRACCLPKQPDAWPDA